MGLFGAAHGLEAAKRPCLPKICHTYSTTMKIGTVIPYLKKIQKTCKLCGTPLQFCWHQHFFTGSQQLLGCQEILIQTAFSCMISNYFIFFKFLKVILINMVSILMMSAKLAALGLLKIKVFWNKGYSVIIYVHDVTSKILSPDSNYIIDVVMWPKFGNSGIFKREVIVTSIL